MNDISYIDGIACICNNCLYFGSDGITCTEANNLGKFMVNVNSFRACEYFWLNQHKYLNASRRR